MMKTPPRRARFALLGMAALPLLLTVSCRNSQVVNLQRETLFSVDIGKMEDQLDLFQVTGAPMSHLTTIYMRDGIFFISNPSSNKVMEFTSYGDLLALYYNPEQNPEPVTLQVEKTGSKVTNRAAYPYYFNQLGRIAVTRDKYLLAEDRLPEERGVYDKGLGVLLDRVVLRFNENGKLLDFLGQEGIGGTPFPFIDHIYVTHQNDIVVVCKTPSSWIVFWYSSAGVLRYNVTIPLNQLPAPKGEKVLPTLETVIPDQDLNRVYLKVNFHHQSTDNSTGVRTGIHDMFSRIYWINLDTGRYAKEFVSVPENIQRVGGANIFGRQEVQYQYEFIGTAPGGHLFLLSQEDNNREQLLIMHTSGRVVRRRYIQVDDSRLVYKTFSISPEGILSGLLVWDDHAEAVWWRSDKLFDREGS